MRIVRDNSRAVALVAAIFIALGGGIADAAIALHGPNPQFPLCGPQRTEFPSPPADRAKISEHCNICPLTGTGPAIEVPPYEANPDWAFVIERSGLVVVELSVERPELRPIVGRGPPLRN